MSKCYSCGQPVEGTFCTHCGTSLQPPPFRSACVLCYALFFVTGLLYLLLPKYRRNLQVRFHAWQSILFSVAALLFAAIVFSTVFYGMVGVGKALGSHWDIFLIVAVCMTFLVPPLTLAVVLLTWIAQMLRAWSGKTTTLPFVTKAADRLSRRAGTYAPTTR
jgi:uncharacterized membrane protein